MPEHFTIEEPASETVETPAQDPVKDAVVDRVTDDAALIAHEAQAQAPTPEDIAKIAQNADGGTVGVVMALVAVLGGGAEWKFYSQQSKQRAEIDAKKAEQRGQMLDELEPLLPGLTMRYTMGSARRMHWPSVPTHEGSYACFRPGQAAWAGLEGLAEGALHFAGEHTSVEAQGYMEGAAESGARAAIEVLDALGVARPEALKSRAAARTGSSRSRRRPRVTGT